MRDEDGSAAGALRDFREKGIAGVTRGGLNGFLLFCGQSAHRNGTDLNGQIMSGSELPHKQNIGRAGAAAELMIEMADDQVSVTLLQEPMKQGHRIATARDADEIAVLDRKIAQYR